MRRRCALNPSRARPARRGSRPTTSSGRGTRPGSRPKASRFSGGISIRLPPWPIRWRSRTGTRPAGIAWAPEDAPTDAQIEAVLDAFGEATWVGLEPDRYAWAPVLHHEEDGGAHVQVLAARCDLDTGRSPNIAPPGWQKTFGAVRNRYEVVATLRGTGFEVPRQG